MRRFVTFLSVVSLLLPAVGRAAASSGDLIKGSGDAVYYLGADAKRYVFPTSKTYFSWYADFSVVKAVSDAELASYRLGGNVTYRPGVRLVKITTDPKVYAVARGGLLRWIQTEAVASALYGADWNRKVDDIPDTFFINYRSGDPIAASSDYNPSTETAAATTINADKNLQAVSAPPEPPTPPPAPPPSGNTLTLDVSKTNAQPGEIINLSATAMPSASIQRIDLYFNNALVKTCEFFTPCGAGVTAPSDKATTTAVAVAQWIDAQRRSTTTTVTIAQNGSVGVVLDIPHPEVRQGNLREAIATIDTAVASNRFVEIYLDGNLVKACDNSTVCRFADTETSSVGTIHALYALSRDVTGIVKRSPTKTLTVVLNEHPLITVTPGKTILSRNELVDVTVGASDPDGISWSEIWQDGARVKHCDLASCTMDFGPWNQARTASFVGKASDAFGLIGYGTSTDVMIQ